MGEVVTESLGAIKAVMDFCLLHWQFISFAAILACLGEASDRVVTAAVTERWIPRWMWRLARATLPSHPVLIGLLAAALGLPAETGVATGAAAYAYWGSSGVFSLVFWGILRSLGRKASIDLSLPGEEPIDINRGSNGG